MNELLNKLKSRKLWAAVFGSALIAFGTELGLDEETSQQISHLIIAYIVGQGLVDFAKEKKNVNTNVNTNE